MERISKRRLIRQSALAAVWLAATLGFIVWMRPDFWQSPHELFLKARELKEAGQVSEAVRAMREAVAERPNDEGYLAYLGALEIETGDYEAAGKRFARAMRSSEPSEDVLLGYAESLVRQNRHEEARKALERISQDSLQQSHLRRLGQLYALNGDYPQALALFKQFVSRSSKNAEVRLEALSLATAVGDWEYAASISEPLVGDAELDQKSWNNRAVALRALGQKEAAYRILLTHAAPSNLRERAELALELEDFQRAAEFYQELVKREGAEASPEARSSLAYALTRLGRGEEAVALYQKIMASDNSSRQDRIRFAWLLNARGEYEKAWEVIKPDPRPSEDLEILELQARTAYWAEKMEEAAPLLKLLIKRKESR